ncbi:hypothetical protein D9756_000366 [Leucocoprinus leucothites]|uniref:STB6-like N-terminal domain-containing protein n=1 Tax=Leucocoprinus leucothites TaxID=201217 RepID=A0A8H5GEN2_9AGAR|nr:hypothetical protein D9756_000366 [Leucoagaricus leucothites]
MHPLPVRRPSAIAALPPPSRLLLPRVHTTDSPRRPHTTRARSSSLSRSPLPNLPSNDTALEWLGLPLAFDVVQEQLEIDGYQMYAVEKWIVERNRPITVLTVYTGDPSHKITVTALAPSASLSKADAAAHWEQAILHLRRDASARPKQTPAGVLMATSLAYFRSDYTIVHIPHGNFLLAKDQLYTNINLLRMGCGGRSALTLEEPRFVSSPPHPANAINNLCIVFSDSTKDRFVSTYHIPEITLPSTLPLPLYHHPYPTSSDHLPLPASQPISASSSLASRDAHLGSPTRRPSHYRSQSQTSPRGTIPRAGSSRPSIHIVGPSPTPSGIQSTATSFSSPSILALLSTHTKGKSKDLPFFNATVLELVKLVQTGLSLFGMYDVKESMGFTGGRLLVDGLLCDITVRGIERWIAEIGEPRAGLEPAERIVDPMFVSALLSLVLSIRNKLSTIGHSHSVPKDPFLHPHAFSLALSSYISSMSSHPSIFSPQTSSPSSPPMIPTYIGSGHHHLPLSPMHANVTTAPFSATVFLNSGLSTQSGNMNTSQPHVGPTVLTRELVEIIESTYTKRIVSMNEGESTSTGALGSGIVGIGGGAGSTGIGSPSSALRDSSNALSGGGGPSGSSVMPKSQARRRVKRALKGKLEDLTSAVTTTTDHYDGGEAGDGGKDDSRISGVGNGGGGGTLSGTEADGNLSVGSSGGQILRGMGNLILSGASGIAGVGSNSSANAACTNTWDVNVDLERFITSITEHHNRKLGVRGRRKKGSGKGSESVDFGRGIGSGGLPLSSSAGGTGGRSSTMLPGIIAIVIPQSVANGEHGALVTMLWSGRVADVVALREWEKERERVGSLELSGLPNSSSAVGLASGVVSDGEEAKSEGMGERSTEGEDSDLQMDGRHSGSFGGVWSGKVQRKLGNWTGLSKRRGQPPSNEFGSSIGRSGKGGANRFSLNSKSPSQKVVSGESPTATAKADPKLALARAQSPTLHSGPLSGDLEQEDMLCDSGQVSPTSEYKHNPFTLEEYKSSRLYDISRGVSTAELGRSGSSNADSGQVPPSKSHSVQHSTDALASVPPLQPAIELDAEKKTKVYGGLGLKAGDKWEGSMRPVHQQQRVSSWSDTRSAWNDEGFWMSGNLKKSEKVKARRPRLGRASTTLDGAREEEVDVIDHVDVGGSEEDSQVPREREAESDKDGWRRVKMLGARRRSYHDLDSLRSIKVLSPERMRVDVELCAQVLIMARREEHLRNVIACLETLTSTLYTTNSLLQNDFELHKDAILEIERRAKVISEIEDQVLQMDAITQTKNTLHYESAQFLISELWHTASLSRKKVFELREKVFGAGGRRLPSGVNGAHGRFNRVQWTMDGERRLVDYLGRTEEEAEEENRVNVVGLARPPPPPEEDEENVVEHPGIKPMWLLRFFTSWGARWSALRVGSGQQQTAAATQDSEPATDGSASAPGTAADKQ